MRSLLDFFLLTEISSRWDYIYDEMYKPCILMSSSQKVNWVVMTLSFGYNILTQKNSDIIY